MSRFVTFDESCAYDSADYNSQDVNKLFGLSFGFGGVHRNSARFGWRWSKSDQCIELLAYVYKNGKRNQDEQLRFPVVVQIKLRQRVRCEIKLLGDHYLFTVHSAFGSLGAPEFYRAPLGAELVSAPFSLPHYGLTHGFYFGGELVCPHTMRVRIDRSL